MATRADKPPGEIMAVSDFLEHRMESILIAAAGTYFKRFLYSYSCELCSHVITPPHITKIRVF